MGKKNLFRKEIQALEAYHLVTAPRAIRLSHNELPEGFSGPMKRELGKKWREISIERYPGVQPTELRRALAKKLKVKESEVLVANGSNVLINTLVTAAAVGQKVMAPDPSFALYEFAARALGNRFIPLPLKAPDFQLDGPQTLKRIKTEKPQIIFIANPNAPTGNLFDSNLLDKIIRQAPGLVVLDEAYAEFTGVSFLPKIKKHRNLVLLRTLSKSYGFGGGRLGFAISNQENIVEISKVLAPYCVNLLSEAAALVALKHEAHFKKIRKQVIGERERVFLAMKKLSGLEVYPSQTNFLLFRVSDGPKCFSHLVKKGVLVRDQGSHHGLKGCLRVTIGKRKENEAFLKALGSFKG